MTAWALRRCGARPLRITPARGVEDQRLQGVVIGGGTDVDPFHYGEEQLPDDEDGGHNSPLDWLVGLVLSLFRALFARHSRQGYDPDRDRLEKHLIRHALYDRLPILGICRGAQLMNVALGGSLYQDIGHFYTEDTGNVRSILPRKAVSLSEGSALRRILGTSHCMVNALHDQSIKDLGTDIIVSAREPSGVIQGIEKAGHPYFIGVQWHPEYIPQSAAQLGLFQALVDRARGT
jgi:putative glutamine amidotransferase